MNNLHREMFKCIIVVVIQAIEGDYAKWKLIKQFTWVNTVTVDKTIASRCVILHRG